ncbi:predicted protein [Uncinocarpus reesii 1704]|uniref:N-acetyltransferase domain-containing protein n=1 Tax=Uncinocarpus reesii (strain UAMH 1704) TaxID=336963 RepID=C4JH97_UNCRE|nr:uncharacterized protein UREG_02670 [Uncinocarpus reesii 1704]EEP77821.1 predicted protein [Uncinocarpus reesii 1704]
MDPIIFTPRLKLTLVTKAERGSPELEWLHELRSSKEATWWSIHGQSKSIEDTESNMKHYLPAGGEENSYRVVYVVHKILEPLDSAAENQAHIKDQREKPTEVAGLVILKSLDAGNLAIPEELTVPAAAASTTLTTELGYSFLPTGWGKGYATESLKAVLESCKRAQSFWAPFSKVYVRAIVNEENPASLRVMEKAGVPKKGVYVAEGEPIFLAGKWRGMANLHIYGMYLIE